MVRKLLILILFLSSTMFLYAQEETILIEKNSNYITQGVSYNNDYQALDLQASNEQKESLLDLFNNKAYAATINEEQERQELRTKWKNVLKIDIFYPYFKAKEVEDWVSDKASVDFLKLKGRPQLENNQIQYIFKTKF